MHDRLMTSGEFEPHTPLAQKLWERRKAVLKEAQERGDPLLHSWEEVEQEVQERRGTREIEDDRRDALTPCDSAVFLVG
jgi:hypothetical protein